jgi:LysR family transcriptional regulator, glycine cleavage system transcriptional activator
MTTRQLPPLAAIRAFEAALRHLSFTKAARELGMTQAAVSYQIKLLEERVGAPLFLRLPRSLALSEAGQRLAPATSEAFEILRTAYAETRSSAQGTLVISTVQTFASYWLARHLGAFQLAHPSLAVRLDSSSTIADFAREEVDVAIRSGNGSWPGLATHLLLHAEFTPLLSPALLARHGGLASPADLQRLPLLDRNDVWWRHWFTAAGVPDAVPEAGPDIRLGTQYLDASAAIAGQGVALLTPAFFKAELAAGMLVQPFDLVCRDGHAIWLVYPEARRNAPKIRIFRDWLLAEAQAASYRNAEAPGSGHPDAASPAQKG